MLQFIGGFPLLLVELGQGGVLGAQQLAQPHGIALECRQLAGLQLVGLLQGVDGLVGGGERLAPALQHPVAKKQGGAHHQHQDQQHIGEQCLEGAHASTPPNSVNLASRSASWCSRWP
ncbi:hypothetical protein I6L47_12310 [Aeromonas sp. FDAARGOS 1417]|nr:hypothetical protein I6L47_12310 [Aeromonas sp. FDAARGOS 1417]